MRQAAPPPYAEFAVTTNFSFLRGASDPEELVLRAKQLGLSGIGIADRNSVAGAVKAFNMAKAQDMRLAVGARLIFADGTPDILAYPSDRTAWGRLTRLLSRGKLRAEKGDCILYLSDLLEWIEGLNLIVMPPARSDAQKISTLLARLKQHASKQSIWLATGFLYRGDDYRRMRKIADIAQENSIPLIATNDVLYHDPQRRMLQDVITCIREHVTIDGAGQMLTLNAERHLKPPQEMKRLLADFPQAIVQTQIFLDQCRFSLRQLRETAYPHEAEANKDPQETLVALAKAGFKKRFGDNPRCDIRKILKRELQIIGEMNYAPFFLTVYNIMEFAKSRPEPILCQGRGSAANSTICYCLGIT